MPAHEGLAPMFELLAMLPAATRASMVRMYHASLLEHTVLLDTALRTGDTASARSLSHKIGGSAAMMQDLALSRAARDIEAALGEGRPHDAARSRDQLSCCAARTLEALAADTATAPGLQARSCLSA